MCISFNLKSTKTEVLFFFSFCQLCLSHWSSVFYLYNWFCNPNTLNNLNHINIAGIWPSGPGIKFILAFAALTLLPNVVTTMNLISDCLECSSKLEMNSSHLISTYYMPDTIHILPYLMFTMEKYWGSERSDTTQRETETNFEYRTLILKHTLSLLYLWFVVRPKSHKKQLCFLGFTQECLIHEVWSRAQESVFENYHITSWYH